MYYYGHLSVIPDSKRFVVKNIVENRIISTLDDRFVASNVEEGSVFITKGLPWKVISIDDEVISVEPSTDLDAAVPDWTGEDIPVSRDTVLGVFRLLNSPGGPGRQDAHPMRAVNELIAKQATSFLPSDSTLFVESLEEYCVIYTGLGTQANEALSRLLAHMISSRLGRSVNTRASPYMIMLELGRDFDIARLLGGLASKSVEKELRDSVADTELFRYRFITIAKLFGVIERDAAVSRAFAKRILAVMKDSPIYDETLRELLEGYFDVATLKRFIERIESGAVKIGLVRSDAASAFTRTILASAHYTRELIMPLTPNSELAESFSRFIFSKSVKMLCTYCGFFFGRKLNEIKDMESLMCPSCGSPMISIYSDDYKAVVDKRISGKKLGRKELATMNEALRYAGLISSYGAKAVVALSVYGVGPQGAARILMMRKHDEHSFFMDLLEAQKNFIRTKKYWSI